MTKESVATATCIHGKPVDKTCRKCEFLQAKQDAKDKMPEYTETYRVPEPKGKTPNRGFRIPPEIWNPALRISRFHGTSLTSVMRDYLLQYIEENRDVLEAMDRLSQDAERETV